MMSEPSIWDRYWQDDRIASCLDGAGLQNYGGGIAEGWRAFFDRLPEGARILDLCCGNGAVALIAAESGRARSADFKIVAVDQAAIDPAAHVSRHREALAAIEFRPRTPVEDLPFADRSFDAVVSQYGVEYGDVPRALTEIGRVAAPGARARLVMHAADGVVGRDSRRVLEEADFLLETIDLPGAAQRCFVAVGAAERDAQATAEAHQRARESLAGFESAMMETARRVAGAADKTMLRNAGAVLLDTFTRRARLEVDQMVAKADALRAEIEAHRGRLKALVEAAVGPSEVAAIADGLIRAGASAVRRSELRNGPDLIGHVVEADFGG